MRESKPGNCKFDKLGVRVPAVIVSPFAPKGLGSSLFPKLAFDHSSIVAFLRETFNLGAPLTARDAWAPTWSAKLSSTPRRDLPPLAKVPKITVKAPAVISTAATSAPVDGSLAGFAAVAADVDRYIAKHSGTPPLIASTFALKLPAAALALNDAKTEEAPKKSARKTVVSYLAAVHARVGLYEAMQKSVPIKELRVKKGPGAKGVARPAAKKRTRVSRPAR